MKYLPDDNARMCAPTDYAKAQGAWASDDYKTASGKETCWWWLRSPCGNQFYAAFVSISGSVDFLGNIVSDGDDCIRPAMWISLEG